MDKPHIPLQKFKFLDGSWLKIIAMLSMLIDHTAYMLQKSVPFLSEPISLPFGKSITVYYIMRMLGRLAFPIFCFLIAEGFYYTRNKKKYGFNLLIFAIISELPFNLLISRGKHLFYTNKQNIFFTLFLGFLVLYILECKLNTIFKLSISVSIVILSSFLRIDYGTLGVILIIMLYVLRNNNIAKTIIAKPLLSGGYPAWSAFVLINLYNGKRGFIQGKFLKYVFYAFYPVHILILYIILKLIQM